jgi:cell division protein FtsL
MARSAAATAPRSAPRRAPTARAQAAPKRAPARRAPARHAGRARTTSQRGAAAHRRVSGASAGAPAVALPVRVLNAPFTRAVRARTGSLLDALLSGRGWIALVFVLLAGIVFFNVDLLQMNRDIARDADRISALKRENARFLLEEARLASSERIQESAALLGLVLPAPGEVRYLRSRPPIDAKNASKHISAPDSTYVPPDPATSAPDPATGAPDPAAGAPDPAATAPGGTTTADPAAGGASTSGPVDPATGLPVDPATGRTMYSPTGEALDPATGLPLSQG